MHSSKFIQRALSIFLAILTLVSMLPNLPITPQIAYADESNGYVGDGDGNVGLSDGLFRANWNDIQQGVRVSIVDADMNNMLAGQKPYTAIDIVFSAPPSTSNGFIMVGNKFEDPKGSGTNTYILPVGLLNNLLNISIQDSGGIHNQALLQTYTVKYPKQYEGMPRPILGTAGNTVGNGEQVKQFFIAGELGSFTSSGGGTHYKPVVSIPGISDPDKDRFMKSLKYTNSNGLLFIFLIFTA